MNRLLSLGLRGWLYPLLAAVSSLSWGETPPAPAFQERDAVFAQYATLRTIAGLSEEEDDNFWEPRFEGALATEVELSNPHITGADASDNYYIADKESHSILRIDSTGRLHTHAGTHVAGFNGDSGDALEVQLDNPNGLHVHPNGVVYILDFFNRRIRKVDREGHLTTLVHDTSGFGPGRGLWVHPDEDLIYFNGSNQIKRWTPGGGIETVVDSISDPGNLTVDSNGALVVTSRGAHRVYRVGNGGALTVIAGDGSDGESEEDGVPATSVGLESVRGVAFLPSGAFFVATQKGGDVWFVDTEGLIHQFIGGRRSGNVVAGEGARFSTAGDKISEPRAVTVAPNGNVIITSNDKGVVRIVERFQRPRFQWHDDRWILEVTAGRVHTLEESQDLRTWSLLRQLDPATRSAEGAIGKDTAFFRVRW